MIVGVIVIILHCFRLHQIAESHAGSFVLPIQTNLNARADCQNISQSLFAVNTFEDTVCVYDTFSIYKFSLKNVKLEILKC